MLCAGGVPDIKVRDVRVSSKTERGVVREEPSENLVPSFAELSRANPSRWDLRDELEILPLGVSRRCNARGLPFGPVRFQSSGDSTLASILKTQKGPRAAAMPR
jgi:hypothetical protein